MSETTVAEWMHAGVISCRPDTPVEEVAGIMETEDISALVVVGDAGEAVGVISRTDLVNARFVQPYWKHWRGMNAAHLMSRPVISVTAGTPVGAAVELLRERKIHRLVVVEGEGERTRPVGILSVTDLIKHVGELEDVQGE